MWRFLLPILLFFSTGALGSEIEYLGKDLNWKAVFMTGDNSIQAFDNAREEAAAMWRKAGVKGKNIRQLSMNRKFQKAGVRPSSAANLERALKGLKVRDGDGCLVWMSSHGNEDGLYMAGQNPLSPNQLDKILKKTCGQRPTVLMVSACHSGVFLDLKDDHRVILTAAHRDRKSFGCGIKDVYTFWDTCIIKYYEWSKTFEGLNYRTQICIKNREAEEEVIPSNPQAFFGKDVKYLMVPRRARR